MRYGTVFVAGKQREEVETRQGGARDAYWRRQQWACSLRREELEKEGGGLGSHSSLQGLLWHSGSAYGAWFSCASNKVAQVPLTLPYPFSH
ncbi:hypothetical protein HN51_059368 [Arachis hypogaea]